MSNIVEATGPGGAVFDYDNDGLMDIYCVNGRWHPDISDNRGRSLKGKLRNALYRNNGDGTFTDVTEKAGVAGYEESYGMAASAADYDRDGDLDLYVCNYGRSILYRNLGDGTFADVTDKAGVPSPGWALAAPWLDYNGDGSLDLFVVHYLEYDKGAFQRTGAYYKADNFPGPLSYPGQPDHLYRNNGDGTFTEVTRETGLWEPSGRGMGAVAADLDGDGDVDIYVTNDAMPNNLWVNDGKGRFSDLAAETGTAFGEGGQGVSSMGPFVADVDRNGLLDLLIPDMGYSSLLFQVKRGLFLDVTAQSGRGRVVWAVHRLGRPVERLRQRWARRPFHRERRSPPPLCRGICCRALGWQEQIPRHGPPVRRVLQPQIRRAWRRLWRLR